MATRWTIKGKEFVHCNCAYGCPCQFNALPTHGHCQAVAAIDIEQGHHDGTDLSGLRIGLIVAWPGPIHEGMGEAVPIVDERADYAPGEAEPVIIDPLGLRPRKGDEGVYRMMGHLYRVLRQSGAVSPREIVTFVRAMLAADPTIAANVPQRRRRRFVTKRLSV